MACSPLGRGFEQVWTDADGGSDDGADDAEVAPGAPCARARARRARAGGMPGARGEKRNTCRCLWRLIHSLADIDPTVVVLKTTGSFSGKAYRPPHVLYSNLYGLHYASKA